MEPVISPFKPINRPLKIDRYNGTTYIRVCLMMYRQIGIAGTKVTQYCVKNLAKTLTYARGLSINDLSAISLAIRSA